MEKAWWFLVTSVALLALAGPVHSATVAYGRGEATFYTEPGVPCPIGSDRSVLVGVANEALWRFVVGDANPTLQLSCAIATGEAFTGAWDPSVGGCLPGVAGGALCLTRPRPDLAGTLYDLVLDTAIAGTVTGKASLTFT